MSYYDDLGGDPFSGERSEADIELAEYIQEYGLDVGLAIFREDNGLDLSPADIEALERFANGEDSEDDQDEDDQDEDSIELDLNDDRGINTDFISGAGEEEVDVDDTEWGDLGEVEWRGSEDPDSDNSLYGDFDPYERDDALDLSPDNGFEPYEYEYTIYMNDGTVREGSVMIYHEDTDIEDVIWAANEDLDYEDGVIG